MLVLSRKKGEGVVVGQNVRVTVLEVSGSRVKLGFSGPPEVPIHREEIFADIEATSPRGSATVSCPMCECF